MKNFLIFQSENWTFIFLCSAALHPGLVDLFLLKHCDIPNYSRFCVFVDFVDFVHLYKIAEALSDAALLEALKARGFGLFAVGEP